MIRMNSNHRRMSAPGDIPSPHSSDFEHQKSLELCAAVILPLDIETRSTTVRDGKSDHLREEACCMADIAEPDKRVDAFD